MKHKMWSRLLSMVLAVMMIASIVPTSAFAEAASEIAASSQAVAEVVEQTEEVTLPEDTTTEEPAAETPAQEPAAETPAEEPAGEPVPTAEPAPEPAPTAEPVAEPTETPATENEQPTAEPTQAPAETAVPSEQPSVEPTAAPEGTETPEATAVPSATPVPSESPLPSETPVPTEEPAIDGQALLDELMAIEDDEAFMKAVNELTEEQVAALEALGEEALAEYALRVETLTAQEETVEMNAEPKEFTTAVEGAEGVTVTVNVPAGALPVDAKLVAKLIEEETEEYNEVKQVLDNETPNELAESEEDAEQTGMIAMDIHFEMNGQEIEPKAAVQVTIDAQALLPENVDPETVAVKHLKEDENGEVAVETVADATEQTAGEVVVEEAQTEEPSVNMSTTFSVESFSNFTIEYSVTRAYGNDSPNDLIWMRDKKTVKFSDTAELYIIDRSGNQVGEGHAVDKRWTNGEIEFYEILRSLLAERGISNPEKYGATDFYLIRNNQRIDFDKDKFGNWYIYESGGKYLFGMVALKSKYGNNSEQYIKEGDKYYIVVEKLQEVNTVDSSKLGVTINIFNYTQDDINKYKDERGRDRERFLRFNGSEYKSGDVVKNWINSWGGDGGGTGLHVIQGILAPTLGTDGYPRLADRYNSYDHMDQAGTGFKKIQGRMTGESLAYLFDDSVVNGKAVYRNRNHLFLKSEYDKNQYFVYDSSQNFATLMNDGEVDTDFTVYSIPNPTNAKFMPFDTYGTQHDFHFGMEVSFKFNQPKDGKLNGEPMKFEFNGDDDLWVFVDGVLVLDIGGIHGAKEGSIDFATGNVIVNGVQQTNLATQLKNNDVEKGVGNNTLQNYTQHEIKIYYFERGMGDSNCKMKFNIPPVPAGTLDIAKDVSFTNTADASDIDFEFEAYIDTDPNDASKGFEQYKGNKGTYNVYTLDGDHLVEAGRIAEDGIITVKDGQYARITNPDIIKANSKYYVIEKGATSDKYEVTIDETKLSYVDEKGEFVSDTATENAYGVRTPDYTVDNQARVIFENIVQTENLYALHIKKDLVDGQTGSDEQYVIQATIGGSVYTGDYYINEISEANKHQAEDGKILLKADETAIIMDLMGGNTVRVEELVAEGETKYELFSYKIEGAIDPSTKVTEGYAGATTLEGKELGSAGSKVTVTVMNKRLKGDLVINKTIVNNGNLTEPELTQIKNSLKFEVKKANGELVRVDENTDGMYQLNWSTENPLKGTITLNNLEAGPYIVTEHIGNAPNTVTCTTTVEVTGNGTAVTGTQASGVLNEGYNVLTFDFTNTYAPANGTLKIFKDIDGKELGGGKDVFNFRIDKMDGSTVEQTWYMHVDGEGYAYVNGTEQTDATKFIGLPAGDYTVTELDNINYTFKDVSATKDGQDTGTVNKENQSITVKVGDDEITKVTFTNTPKPTNVPSDGSAVINGMQKDSNNQFTLTFEQKKELGQELPQTTTSN